MYSMPSSQSQVLGPHDESALVKQRQMAEQKTTENNTLTKQFAMLVNYL